MKPGPLGRFKRCVGHTLIELLIASALGASVMVAALALQQRATRDSARVVDHARMQMDGLAARDLLRTYALLAGYGEHLRDARRTRIDPPMRGCVSSMRGADDAAAHRLANLCAMSATTADGVAIRYLADPISVWRSGPRDAPADCEGVALDTLRGKTVNAYLRVRAVAKPNERRLHCSSRNSVAGQPMVGGLDDLQLRYWVGDVSVPLRADELAADDWYRVRGIEACVIVKGRVRTGSHASMSDNGGCGRQDLGSSANGVVSMTGGVRGPLDRTTADGSTRTFVPISIAIRNRSDAP